MATHSKKNGPGRMRPGLRGLWMDRLRIGYSQFCPFSIGSLPSPSIFPPIRRQASANGIFQDICNFVVKALRRSQDVIERFLLPNRTVPLHFLIDCASRGSFDSAQDLNEREESMVTFVDAGSQDQTHMIWHYDSDVEFVFLAVIMQARQHKIARTGGQDAAAVSDEGDEMRFEIPLQMRQIALIELHDKILALYHCGEKRISRKRVQRFPARESRRGGRIRPPCDAERAWWQ